MSTKKNHYFRCINGVVEYFEKDRKQGNVLSFINEIWLLIENDETGFSMECVEGPNVGFEFGFTLQQLAECFVWEKNYTPPKN